VGGGVIWDRIPFETRQPTGFPAQVGIQFVDGKYQWGLRQFVILPERFEAPREDSYHKENGGAILI
jgi:hypothetical protein